MKVKFLIIALLILLVACSPKNYKVSRETGLYSSAGGKLNQLAILKPGTLVEPAAEKLLCKDFQEEGTTLTLCDVRINIQGIPPRGWVLKNAIQ